MKQHSISEDLDVPVPRQGDHPPPYTESFSDVSTARSTPSATHSVATTRSSSPALPIVLNGKVVLSPRAAEPPEDSAFSQADTLTGSDVALPPDLQRAKAPLRIEQKNSSITGNFLLVKDHSKKTATPDLILRTTNSRISSAVCVEASDWAHPVAIEAETTNSSITLAAHTLQASQAVNIHVTTTNASCILLLPNDFKGLLILSTTNAKKTLTPHLQSVSVRVSNQHERNGQAEESTTHRLHEPISEADNDASADWYEINGSDGPSRAVVKTTNSKILVGIVGDEGCGGEGTKKSCVVM